MGDRDTFIQRQVDAQLAALTSPWFLSLLRSDAGADWRRVTSPTLGVFGGKDVQVIAAAEAPAMRAALEAAGNTDITIVTLPDANHLFQSAVTGALAEYQHARTGIHPGPAAARRGLGRRAHGRPGVTRAAQTDDRFDWHPEPELLDVRDPARSRAALERLGRDAWAAALDYLYDEAFRRAMGEPTTAVPLRAEFFGPAGGPGPAPVEPTRRPTCWPSSATGSRPTS